MKCDGIKRLIDNQKNTSFVNNQIVNVSSEINFPAFLLLASHQLASHQTPDGSSIPILFHIMQNLETTKITEK